MKSKKHVLVIIGHPSTKSLSHKLAKAYASGARSVGKKVEIIDVYRLEPSLPLVAYEDYLDWGKDNDIRKIYQDKIASANTIAVFHPLWWGGMPPLLKNFIDQTLTPGFAYKYRSNSLVPQALNIMPKGLLNGKKADIFITHDAYYFVYLIVLFPFVSIWAIFILYFCGIRQMRFMLHQRVRWSNDKTRQKWINRAVRKGKKS